MANPPSPHNAITYFSGYTSLAPIAEGRPIAIVPKPPDKVKRCFPLIPKFLAAHTVTANSASQTFIKTIFNFNAGFFFNVLWKITGTSADFFLLTGDCIAHARISLTLAVEYARALKSYFFKQYIPGLKNDWIRVVDNSDDTWLFHDPEILSFFIKMGNSENISIIMYDKDNLPVAVCPLFKTIIKHPFFIQTVTVQSLNNSGPAFISKFGKKKRRALELLMAKELLNIIKKHHCNYFSTYAPCLAKNNLKSFVNPLINYQGFSELIRTFYYLDLKKSEHELIAAMETRTRTILSKKSTSDNFEIKSGQPGLLNDMLQISKYSNERLGDPDEPSDRVHFDFLLKSEKFKTFIGYKFQKPFCFVVFAIYKNTGHFYLYDNVDTKNNPELGTQAIWHAIKYARNNGIEHFDLGINRFSATDEKDDKVSKFKRGFGGTLKYKFQIQRIDFPKWIVTLNKFRKKLMQ